MEKMSVLLPNLAKAVSNALRIKGYELQAEQLSSKVIDRWTYDEEVNAGYIYFVQDVHVQNGETPAAETVPFMNGDWFNVDLRASGELFGLELLSHEHVFHALGGTSSS